MLVPAIKPPSVKASPAPIIMLLTNINRAELSYAYKEIGGILISL